MEILLYTLVSCTNSVKIPSKLTELRARDDRITLILHFLQIFMCCLTKFILQRQNTGDSSENAGFTDEEGRPLVMVKYPRSVRCVFVNEDDMASDMAPDGVYCNCQEGDAHECCGN